MNDTNLTDIIFAETSKRDMYISIELHDHILNSVFLALLIGISIGLIIGMNADMITKFLKKKLQDKDV